MIVVTCRVCGAEFAPGRASILGARWRTCPRCREHPPPTGAVPVEPAPPTREEPTIDTATITRPPRPAALAVGS